MLKDAYSRLGSLSVAQINADPELPSDQFFRRRFGSLAAAFAQAGLPRGGPQRKRSVRIRPQSPRPTPARGLNDRRRSSLSDEDLLEVLRKLHVRDGYVSGGTLRAEPGAPHVSLFQARFGSLTSAYQLAGLQHASTDRSRLAAFARRPRFGMGHPTS